MSAELKTIKNTLAIPQNIIYKGRQFVLGPNDEQTFEAVIANAFLEKCEPIVVEVKTELGAVWAPELQARTMWVANVTGNPDAPATVLDRRYDKLSMRFTEVEVPNPNRKARPIARELKGGHKQYTARDGGLVQESLPSKTWVVPTYRRVPMPEADGEWFLNRDAMCGPSRGAVIRSRPRSDFEPDMTWQYEDMRNYARLVDPTMDIGPDDAGIARAVKAEVDKLAFDEKWKPKKIEVELRERSKEALRKAKQELFHRLYFRLVNPDYRLPTRAEYSEFVTGKSQEDVEEAEVEAILAKAEKANKKAEKQLGPEEAAPQ
jgi:hypothetical protein